MSDLMEAKDSASSMFAKGWTVDEVLVNLHMEFESFRFYVSERVIFMEPDECTTPPRFLCNLPDEPKKEPFVAQPLEVLEYAANHIGCDERRGNFVKAFVENDEWAVEEFVAWKELKEND